MTTQTSRRRKGVGIAAAAIGLLAVLFPLLGASPASADTPTNHTVVASTSSQSNVSPNGPLTGLTNGQTVTVTVTQASPADPISGIVAIRQCAGGATIANSADMIPSNTGKCLSTPFNAGSHNVRGPFTKATPSDSFVTGTFDVGVGTESVSWDDGAPHTTQITCDATNPCSLWIQIARTGGNDFVHYDLSFALGTPTAPTGVAATCSSSGADVSWTTPSDFGGTAVLDHYTVSASPTAGGAAFTPVDVPFGTNSTAIALPTQFSAYDVTVTATNTGGNTSPASSPAVSVASCVTAAPVLGVPTVGAGQVDLSWTYSGPTSGLTGYQVTLQQISPAGPNVVVPPVGLVTTQHIGGLTDGTQYRASVHGIYSGGGTSAESNTQDFAPISTLITQTITVRRPQGALVLTQVCTQDGNPAAHAPKVSGGADDPLYGGYPYPQDAVNGDSLASYPTNCGINLGAAKLLTADDPSVPGDETGNYFEATGAINQVTIVDTRDSSPSGWAINAKMGDFTDGAGHTIKGDELGWTPALTYHSAPFTDSSGATYTNAAAAGTEVLPNAANGTGLGASLGQVLGSAPVGGRLGLARYDAALKLWIPVTARTGNYSGVLTITAI